VIRVADADGRRRLRFRWYAEEVRTLFRRMLLLVILQAVLLIAIVVFSRGASRLEVPTGETTSEALVAAAWGLAIVSGWPLLMLLLLRVLRWPQLLRATGVAVLAATSGRGLAVWLGHLAAAANAQALSSRDGLWVLANPIDWAFVVFGVILCKRAWRLASDARAILPAETQTVPAARLAWARSLLVVTGLYGLALLGFAGYVRYESSAAMLQPGVDPRREQQALLALDEGARQANNGRLEAAERSFQRALGLWEELTKNRSSPARYRVNLALTLYNLGWVRHKQGRTEEALKYYARAVSIADSLGNAPEAADDNFKETMASAREMLADEREDKRLKALGEQFKALEEKDRTACRKYEEAVVKIEKGDRDAETLLQEAIAAWEEILPQATNEEYRKDAVFRLGLAHLRLGGLQQQLGKRAAAEATLKKGVDYWQKAVAREPERPLPKHNLQVARGMLAGLSEQALLEEIDKLYETQQYGAAADRWRQGIKELEEQVRAGTDRELAERCLAHRLHRFAWFLAHCPDDRIRDTKAAIEHARRATRLQADVGDYWHTLAMVEYRNGDWRESLESLEKAKAKMGEINAESWLLTALIRFQLKQLKEAHAALRKADAAIEELRRTAEGDATLRIQLEQRRPTLELLRREAEQLRKENDPANGGGE
jgi:tetratricopeptide (TPR) repeat protein